MTAGLRSGNAREKIGHAKCDRSAEASFGDFVFVSLRRVGCYGPITIGRYARPVTTRR